MRNFNVFKFLNGKFNDLNKVIGVLSEILLIVELLNDF